MMGDGVNIAARLEGVAQPGAICLSEDAYRQVKSRLEMNVSDLGATSLKNISEPVRVYSVQVGKPAVPKKPGSAEKPKPVPRSRRILVATAVAALIVVGAAAGWYLTIGKTAIVASSGPMPVARSGVPTIAILPFANVTGNPQYDPLAQRIGEKTKDTAGNATIWRIVGRSAGAAAGDANLIDAGRQLNADYVLTGNVEAAGDGLRVTFQVDDVHSGTRLWSRTVTPILESGNTLAAEDEVAGRAEGLLSNAILNAERTRLSSEGDVEQSTWACVLQGFASNTKPDTVASARDCLEAAAQREPSNANVWEVVGQCHQPAKGLGLGIAARGGERRKSGHLADASCAPSCVRVSSRPWTAVLSFTWPWVITPPARPTAFKSRRKKRQRSILLIQTCWEASGCGWHSPVTGMKGPHSPKKPSNWRARPPFPTGGGRQRRDIGSEANIARPMMHFSARTSNPSGCRISISPTRCRSSTASMKRRPMSRRFSRCIPR